MKHYVYRAIIDDKVEKKLSGVSNETKPITLLKMLAFEEYKVGEFQKIEIIKETYNGNQLLWTNKWLCEKAETVKELVDNKYSR